MGVGESRLPPRETGGHSEKPVTDLSGGGRGEERDIQTAGTTCEELTEFQGASSHVVWLGQGCEGQGQIDPGVPW